MLPVYVPVDSRLIDMTAVMCDKSPSHTELVVDNVTVSVILDADSEEDQVFVSVSVTEPFKDTLNFAPCF